MIKIENVEVVGLEHAIRGMRNAKNSWDRSDSKFCMDLKNNSCNGCVYDKLCRGTDKELYNNYILGPNDHELATKLAAGGPVHGKYKRMIVVYLDITAPLYWWKEFDTYKVGTVANSCSTMHKIQDKEFTLDDFSHEHLNTRSIDLLNITIIALNNYRDMYNNYNPNDFEVYGCPSKKDIWWQMIQLLPSPYNQKRTIMLNYEVLTNMNTWRNPHKLDEWVEFCKWIESLPYSELITGKAVPKVEDRNSCEGCVYCNSTDIQEHLRECTYCKRAYSKQHEIDAHEDNYQSSESYVAEWKDKVMKTFLGGED